MVAGLTGEVEMGLAGELAEVLAWSGRLPPLADWLPSAKAAADRARLEPAVEVLHPAVDLRLLLRAQGRPDTKMD